MDGCTRRHAGLDQQVTDATLDQMEVIAMNDSAAAEFTTDLDGTVAQRGSTSCPAATRGRSDIDCIPDLAVRPAKGAHQVKGFPVMICIAGKGGRNKGNIIQRSAARMQINEDIGHRHQVMLDIVGDLVGRAMGRIGGKHSVEVGIIQRARPEPRHARPAGWQKEE